jgi:hypothetical protein
MRQPAREESLIIHCVVPERLSPAEAEGKVAVVVVAVAVAAAVVLPSQ